MDSMLQNKPQLTSVTIAVRHLLSVCHVLDDAKDVVCRLGGGDVDCWCVVGFQFSMLHAHKQLKLPWLGGS